jgi:hypothetical protein
MNRWVLIALAACVLGAGCDDNNGVGPSNRPLVFSALLSPRSPSAKVPCRSHSTDRQQTFTSSSPAFPATLQSLARIFTRPLRASMAQWRWVRLSAPPRRSLSTTVGSSTGSQYRWTPRSCSRSSTTPRASTSTSIRRRTQADSRAVSFSECSSDLRSFAPYCRRLSFHCRA